MDRQEEEVGKCLNVFSGSDGAPSTAFTSVWHPSIQHRNRSTSERWPTKAAGLVRAVRSPQKKKGQGACVFHDKDVHGLVYFASVLSSKDTGESSIVNPELSRYPFSSGRAHQRRGEHKIHALTLYHKKFKNAWAHIEYTLTHKHIYPIQTSY